MTIFIQPAYFQLGEYVRRFTENGSTLTELNIAVAYVRMSGVSRISEVLAADGANSRVVVGANQGNTSAEAIAFLYENVDELYICNRGQVVFHPKLYILRTTGRAVVVVGSNNLTGAGLYRNVEAASVLEFDMSLQGEQYEAIAYKLFDANLLLEDAGVEQISTKNIARVVREFPTEIELQRSEADLRSKRKGSAPAAKKKTKKKAAKKVVAELADIPPPDFDVRSWALRVSEKYGLSVSEGTSDYGLEDDKEGLRAGGVVSEIDGAQLQWSPSPKAFSKRLSSWDISDSAAPGQIQIPKRFWNAFPQLENKQLTSVGAEQADISIKAVFHATKLSSVNCNARAVLYCPSEEQPRSNDELRFTLHNKSAIPGKLTSGDCLAFFWVGRVLHVVFINEPLANELEIEGRFSTLTDEQVDSIKEVFEIA